MKAVIEIFDAFLLAYNSKATRKLALVELWDNVEKNYDKFEREEIPNIILDQAIGLYKDYKRSWFFKHLVIDKHRLEFREKISNAYG